MPLPISMKAAATINAVYRAADHPPDVETSLRNASRATTILGKMLEALTDQYAKKASSVAGYITKLGLLAYGLIEISVPRSLWFHVGRYWLQLATLIGTAMIVLGAVFRSPETWKIGGGLLFAVAAITILRNLLWQWMGTRKYSNLWNWLLFSLLFLVGLTVLVAYRGAAIGQGLIAWQAVLRHWLP